MRVVQMFFWKILSFWDFYPSFNCPSRSMANIFSFEFRAKPSLTWPTYPTYFPDPPKLPSHTKYPPTWSTHLQTTQFQSNLTFSTKFYTVDQVSQFWTKFHNFDQISQYWPNFSILTEFHNFTHSSRFWPSFLILTKFHNFDQISQYWPEFTISTKFHNFN